MKLSAASEAILTKVHPDLARVIRRAAADWSNPNASFTITCGGRTLAKQKLMVAEGHSTTLHSRHLIGPSGFACAVDLACMLKGKLTWDWPAYSKLAEIIKAAAAKEKVPVEWGGDWKFKDGPHFQLPWAVYPG